MESLIDIPMRNRLNLCCLRYEVELCKIRLQLPNKYTNALIGRQGGVKIVLESIFPEILKIKQILEKHRRT